MWLLLPAIVFAQFFQILKKQGWEWRAAALGAAVLWGTCVFLVTESLSAIASLTHAWSALLWTVILAAAFGWMIVVRLPAKEEREAPAPSHHGIVTGIMALDARMKTALSASALMCGLVLATALLSPPQTWDAMVYHLPRAVMWMSNHRVGFYPTPDYQQLVFAPWAAYAVTQTMLLSGGDRFVNLVEFLSYLVSAVSVSLIAKHLGAGTRGQILAGIVSLTIPSMVLEASGSMNTAVPTCWIVTSATFLVARNESQRVSYVVGAGLAAGLAILTKGIAYMFLPGILLACWWTGAKPARLKFLRCSWILILAVPLLNGAHFARCYRLTGSPLGMPIPDYTPRLELTMAHKTVSATLANVFKNLSLHLGTPSVRLNDGINMMFRKAIKLVGANPDDREQNWLGSEFASAHFSIHEVHAGNPLHLLALVLAGLVVVRAGRHGAGSNPVWCAGGIAAGFLLFCVNLKWHMWMTRLQLPMFVLGAPLTGYVFDRYFSRRAANLFAGTLLAMGLLFAASNRIRSLVPWSRVNEFISRAPNSIFRMTMKTSPRKISRQPRKSTAPAVTASRLIPT